MSDLTDLIELIGHETGANKKEINLSTLIEDDLGITGEDGYGLIKNTSGKHLSIFRRRIACMLLEFIVEI